MLTNKTALLAILTGSLALSACSDPTSASESNYREAIQGYFDKRDDFPYCFFNYDFPAEFKGERQLARSGVKAELELLHTLGLLEFKTMTLGEQFGNPTTYYGYNPSEEGNEYFSKENGFCIGEPKLLDLKDVSEPYEERGKTYVRGKYTWTIDLPDWAKQPEFYESKAFSKQLWFFKFEKIVNDEAREEYFTLVRNDDGWGL